MSLVQSTVFRSCLTQDRTVQPRTVNRVPRNPPESSPTQSVWSPAIRTSWALPPVCRTCASKTCPSSWRRAESSSATSKPTGHPWGGRPVGPRCGAAVRECDDLLSSRITRPSCLGKKRTSRPPRRGRNYKGDFHRQAQVHPTQSRVCVCLRHSCALGPLSDHTIQSHSPCYQ